ncbi:hypothetical protein BTA51_01985 [Hahella sp. CCB-MM4]|uniref:hypothetical protein n=1 Tax=Hahella sp. (strain CCB-MM4) TaxID=1926491 RepID=UPI000B9B1F3C|nr:hypothetical protein [Hahella sp. CCB-MM4]OZG75178.1 hypothetical protein BTA51_01985 [Hahella sp. CCB-MM4]
MSEYEIIDAICDKVNPLLFLLTTGLLINDLYSRTFPKARARIGFLLGGLVLVYGFLYLDNQFLIWASFGGDYSTHTAFAIAMGVSISITTRMTKWIIGALLLYSLVMLYQGYHSILDIVTTSIIVGLPLILVRLLIDSRNLSQGVEQIPDRSY